MCWETTAAIKAWLQRRGIFCLPWVERIVLCWQSKHLGWASRSCCWGGSVPGCTGTNYSKCGVGLNLSLLCALLSFLSLHSQSIGHRCPHCCI